MVLRKILTQKIYINMNTNTDFVSIQNNDISFNFPRNLDNKIYSLKNKFEHRFYIDIPPIFTKFEA